MSLAMYEFPLCEKVRNYLRLEQLFKQLRDAQKAESEHQYLIFLSILFSLLDLVNRLDFRADFLRDLDSHEKSLLIWENHPNVDKKAFEVTLKSIRALILTVKQNSNLIKTLKEDKLLSTIKSRFEVTAGATKFDLPALYCWLQETQDIKQEKIRDWLHQLDIINQCLTTSLSFLREKARFHIINCEKGYHQGSSDKKIELVRIQFEAKQNIYPMVSGSRSRFGIKFMRLDTNHFVSEALTSTISFKLACC